MSQLSPETIWKLNHEEVLNLLERAALVQKPKKIRFYAPSFTYYKTRDFCSSTRDFPTISITGKSCALNCKHCGGKVLQTMHAAVSEKELFNLCLKLKHEGARGCLVSGGCLPDGSVPLEEFVPALKRIKQELGLTLFVHSGIINLETAVSLKDAGVDAVLTDVIGSSETIKKIYNLNVTPEDYSKSLRSIDAAGLNFVPHIIVGLNEGRLDGELEALNMLKTVKPSAIVIIAFMPIRGTSMAKTRPPKPIDVAKIAMITRNMFPQTPLVLGCMRPKGAARGEIDVLALKAGVEAIAFPSEEAVKYAQNAGFEVSLSSYCCAQMYLDAKTN